LLLGLINAKSALHFCRFGKLRDQRQHLADLIERKRKEAEAKAAKIQKKPPATQKEQTGPFRDGCGAEITALF